MVNWELISQGADEPAIKNLHYKIKKGTVSVWIYKSSNEEYSATIKFRDNRTQSKSTIPDTYAGMIARIVTIMAETYPEELKPKAEVILHFSIATAFSGGVLQTAAYITKSKAGSYYIRYNITKRTQDKTLGPFKDVHSTIKKFLEKCKTNLVWTFQRAYIIHELIPNLKPYGESEISHKIFDLKILQVDEEKYIGALFGGGYICCLTELSSSIFEIVFTVVEFLKKHYGDIKEYT